MKKVKRPIRVNTKDALKRKAHMTHVRQIKVDKKGESGNVNNIR